MSTHALGSPSGASGWLRCIGWESDPHGSKFAAEGTAAHELAADCLMNGTNAADHLGRMIEADDYLFEVDADMATNVQTYIDIVRGIPGQLFVEQRLSIEHLTGEVGAAGTSDAVIIADGELIIIDLKYGRRVKVAAEQNEQLQIYALAALNEFSFLFDFKTVRMMIVQPRLGHTSEWVLPVDELTAFGTEVAFAAAAKLLPPDISGRVLNPGDKQCQWCSRKATCQALAAKVQAEIGAEFEVVNDIAVVTDLVPTLQADHVAKAMAAVDLIESWCKAIRAEVETRLLQGIPVDGYKLVEGRRGSRKWSNEADAEAVLKAMRLKQEEMYDFSLISPTTADKLAKAGTIGPRQWPRLQELITQSEGKPSVAPASDKRPAVSIAATADEFSIA